MTDEVDPALAHALDELGDASLDEFVATRDRLARALKADGRRDDATALLGRRRPSVVAWSVNRVARDRRDLVDALYAAADDVRSAVERSDGSALRTAMRAQRARITELTELALARAADASTSPGAHREAIARTWEAAAADEALREAVASGTLSKELQPGGTVGGTPDTSSCGGTVPVPAKRSRMTPKIGRTRPAPATAVDAAPEPGAPRRRTPRDELAVRRAEDAVAAARRELADAHATASAADDGVARATRAAKRAHEERARAERRVERAARALAERRSR